ncbi:MAG: hypothetical protein E7429_04615 [Ruminococcaceae bacterium]|nr:hypothetical protein [Oscillospiraceae bacterium]
MSASREKKIRQDQANSGYTDPKAVREAEQRAKEKRSTILYGAIACVFVLALAATLIWRSNSIQKKATAVTIDGEAYSAGEVSFYYQNAYLTFMSTASQYSSLLGIDTSRSMKDQTVSETAGMLLEMLGLAPAEAGTIWHDYFVDQALEQMTYVQNALKAAEAAGFTYPESVQIQYDLNMDSLASTAESYNYTMDEFLAANFGESMNQEIYGKHLLRLLQFDAYASDFVSTLNYTVEELEAIYAEDPDSYDKVSYEVVSFPATAESTTDADGNKVEPTEAETEAAKKAAKELADALLAAYTAGEGDLETLAKDYEDAEYNAEDGVTYYTGSALELWLFDEARKAGDCEVVEGNGVFYVLLFCDRYREEYNTIDVRHILIQPEAGTKTSEEEGYAEEQAQLKADAKAKAEDVLAEWKAGEATAVSFAELALKYSTDPGSSNSGGLYTNVAKGEMVEPFEEWCFDPSRTEGDTGIVETPYGYHVMYFSGENQPYWQLQVASPLKAEEYSAWMTNLISSSKVEKHNVGMSFVG